MQRIINTGDFIWLDVTDKAKEIFTTGLFSLYGIDDSQVDYLIETMDQLNRAMENGHKIAIEGGKTEHQPPAPQLLKSLQVTKGVLTDRNQFSDKNTNLLDVISSAINLSRK